MTEGLHHKHMSVLMFENQLTNLTLTEFKKTKTTIKKPMMQLVPSKQKWYLIKSNYSQLKNLRKLEKKRGGANY